MKEKKERWKKWKNNHSEKYITYRLKIHLQVWLAQEVFEIQVTKEEQVHWVQGEATYDFHVSRDAAAQTAGGSSERCEAAGRILTEIKEMDMWITPLPINSTRDMAAVKLLRRYKSKTEGISTNWW